MINPSSYASSFTQAFVLFEEAHHHLSLRNPSYLRIPPVAPDTITGTISAILHYILHARLFITAFIWLDDEAAAAGILEVRNAHAVEAGFGDGLGAEDIWVWDTGVLRSTDGVVDDDGGVAGDPRWRNSWWCLGKEGSAGCSEVMERSARGLYGLGDG